MPAVICGHLWYLRYGMSVAEDRGDNDRGRRDRRVVPIDLGRRDGLGHAADEITDEGALEGVPMLDRVTGGGPRVDHGADDPPKRARSNEPGPATRGPCSRGPPPGRSLPARRYRLPARARHPRGDVAQGVDHDVLRLAPLAAHKLEIAGALILIIGLGATGALLLAHGHPACRAAAIAGRLDVADRRVGRAIGRHPEARDVVDSRTPRCRAAGR